MCWCVGVSVFVHSVAVCMSRRKNSSRSAVAPSGVVTVEGRNVRNANGQSIVVVVVVVDREKRVLETVSGALRFIARQVGAIEATEQSAHRRRSAGVSGGREYLSCE